MIANEYRLYTPDELRRAVRDLAAFVADERAKPTPAIVDALEIYDTASRQVNERLVDSDRLVRLGQRSEALRLAQIDPDVLDSYNLLRFKNYDWLPDLCKDFKLTLPVPLDKSAAARLNEAYSLEKAQQPILREFRLLALSHAPIRRRLEVLRLLKKQAVAEAFWHDDVAAFEQKRLDEIRLLLANPDTVSDWNSIENIYLETSVPAVWQIPVPLDLLHEIQTVRTRLIQKAAKHEMGPLLTKLNHAVDRDEVAIVKQLIAQAGAIQHKYILQPDNPLVKAIKDAEEWLRRRKAERKRRSDFEMFVRQLHTALTKSVDWYYVQEYYARAIEYGMPLPKDVLRLYQRRLRFRRIMWSIGIVVGFLILLGGLAFVLSRL